MPAFGGSAAGVAVTMLGVRQKKKTKKDGAEGKSDGETDKATERLFRIEREWAAETAMSQSKQKMRMNSMRLGNNNNK